MRILGCVVNAHLKQMIHRNSLLIIPECPRMFWLGCQTRCVVLGEWIGLHANRFGPVNSGVLNGCSGGGRRGPTEPAAHIRRRTPGASPNARQCDHRGAGVRRRRGGVWQRTGRREGQERTHRGWKGSVSLSARCDDEYECLSPQVVLMLLSNASQTGSRLLCTIRKRHDAGRKVHSDKVKEMETDCLSCRAGWAGCCRCEYVSWFLPMMTLDTECDWRETEERNHEAMKEDGRKSESET
ncbi:hypothetical protein B0H14DRAFT_2852128 [Mycena olivaceomarginata]|nr:hypothetical protein B0H14DRAFT_2852128 [Mycena olivaceomarginata]